jgi:hypothetical protein
MPVGGDSGIGGQLGVYGRMMGILGGVMGIRNGNSRGGGDLILGRVTGIENGMTGLESWMVQILSMVMGLVDGVAEYCI